MFKLIKFILRLVTLAVLCTILVVVTNYIVSQSGNKTMFNNTDISLLPQCEGIVVINEDEGFNDNAMSKLQTALAVYRQGKSDFVYIFGDAEFVKEGESFLNSNGVPKTDIYTDTGKQSIYNSVYLLGNEYNLESSIFVDGEDKLDRIIYVADKFDIKSFGTVCSDIEVTDESKILEYCKTTKDFLVVNVKKYTPKDFK